MSLTRCLARTNTALLLALVWIGWFPTIALTQGTWRVSVDSAGGEGNGLSDRPSISGDGRYVAFHSQASNLVPGDTNGNVDVFVRDRQMGTTARVSIDSAGAEGRGGSSFSPSISESGRFVAFSSRATNLVPGDSNGVEDVFMHDRQSGETTRLSVDSAGVEGDRGSWFPSISGDGRFVAFSSQATNLVPGKTSWVEDVFVHDRQSGATTRVSVNMAGVGGHADSSHPSISGDGRFVTFDSHAWNLVRGDANGVADVFVHDRQRGATSRVSLDSAGVEGNDHSFFPSISAEGRFVAFESAAFNLVQGDAGGWNDVFVHDRQSGTTSRVSVDSTGGEGDSSSRFASISRDGWLVAFDSGATNLVPGDTNGQYDVFLHDRRTGTATRVSVDSAEVEGNDHSFFPAISADGRFVTFASRATNLVLFDTNGTQDVFLRGAFLTLEAEPDTVVSGDPIRLTTWTGLPSGLAALFLTDINGKPHFFRVALGSFDGDGLWSISGTVPPGLAGNVMTFQAVGFNPAGTLDIANGEAVTFN